MSVVDARTWAGLAASAALHALLGAVLVLYGRVVPIEPSLEPPVDVWAGETVEISDLVDPEATPPTRAPADTGRVERAEGARPEPEVGHARAASGEPKSGLRANPPAERAPERDEPRENANTVKERSPERDEPVEHGNPKERDEPKVDDLAARILAYRPKPRTPPPAEIAEPSSAPEPAPARTAGALGANTEAGPPRNFARAFTRAIPAATTNDRAWTTLPVGSAGELEFVVEIDDEGHVVGRDVGKNPPKHLERLVDQTLLALRGGRFELTGATSGKQRLRIAVNLSDQPLDDGPLALGFRSPGPGAPGLAYFQLASGRRVDVVVTLLP